MEEARGKLIDGSGSGDVVAEAGGRNVGVSDEEIGGCCGRIGLVRRGRGILED